jgi:hypothetical protein
MSRVQAGPAGAMCAGASFLADGCASGYREGIPILNGSPQDPVGHHKAGDGRGRARNGWAKSASNGSDPTAGQRPCATGTVDPRRHDAALVLRSRIVLRLADGLSARAVARELAVSRHTVNLCRARYEKGGAARPLETNLAEDVGRPRRSFERRPRRHSYSLIDRLTSSASCGQVNDLPVV